MKLYIIAGEASGDLHGANLVKSILSQNPDSEIRCWGGDKMEEAGANVVKHYRDLAFMGFTEVLLNIRTIFKNLSFCKKDIQNFAPDVLVLIDYPGFNLRIAKFAHELGIRVIYYISPQLWAWKESRVKQIKSYVDEMLVILPFEKEFYQKHNYPVHFVGHPLLDVIKVVNTKQNDFLRFTSQHNLDSRDIIVLAPGSRKQEIRRLLPVMMKVRKQFPQYQFVIAGAPSQDTSYYQQFSDGDIPVLFNNTYELFKFSKAGLITSGTATLEAALHKLPLVVCYKGGTISYLIAKRLIKVDYISLVNLVAGRELVTELIQNECNVKRMVEELNQLLDPKKRERLSKELEGIRQKLGGSGASRKAASIILDGDLNADNVE